jgi:hypothetical protein
MKRTNDNKTFTAWCAMRNRCYSPGNCAYSTHGAVGITVCDRWLGPHGFANFVADMGERPSPRYRLKRLDLRGDFEPANCRWIENSGMSGTTTYSSWANMKDRCSREKSTAFKYYGARGIKVCDRWTCRNGFRNFLEDMGECPPGMSIDRIDVNGNYEPGNCRWADDKTQARNKRDMPLTAEQVQKIRELHALGMSQNKISKIFGVWQTTIGHIVNRVTWA